MRLLKEKIYPAVAGALGMFLASFALLVSGITCHGHLYEPEIPDALRKNDQQADH